MKISIFGSAGLLGEALVRLYRHAGHDVRGYTRADVDLNDVEALQRLLAIDQSELILNASGMTGLESCLDHPEEAERVNVVAPSEMARYCEKQGIPFVHFSTDYVFGGEEDRYLSESDQPSPISVYGQTKLKGENGVLAAMSTALVCRVSWLFGFARQSFVDQVVKHAELGNPQAYIADKFSVPNFADDLASMCAQLVEKRAKGVVHLCGGGGEVSWFSYAQEVISQMEQCGMIENSEGLITESRLDDIAAFRAKRPRYTSMMSQRLSDEYGVQPTDWRDGLRRFLQEKLSFNH